MKRRGKLAKLLNATVGALVVLSAASVGLFAVGALRNHSLVYWYLLWNLLLAWVPFVLGWYWLRVVRRRGWDSWRSTVLGLGWLVFLPNSFYPITDFVHLYDVPRVDVPFDVMMIAMFAVASMMAGFASVYAVHEQLRKESRGVAPQVIIGAVLLMSSFAVYLGRNLRWNTWDILLSPAAVLFDISSRVLHPGQHAETFVSTAVYFVAFGSLYAAVRLISRR